MSDKGARDHITLPLLIMYDGFTGKGKVFFLSVQNYPQSKLQNSLCKSILDCQKI